MSRLVTHSLCPIETLAAGAAVAALPQEVHRLCQAALCGPRAVARGLGRHCGWVPLCSRLPRFARPFCMHVLCIGPGGPTALERWPEALHALRVRAHCRGQRWEKPACFMRSPLLAGRQQHPCHTHRPCRTPNCRVLCRPAQQPGGQGAAGDRAYPGDHHPPVQRPRQGGNKLLGTAAGYNLTCWPGQDRSAYWMSPAHAGTQMAAVLSRPLRLPSPRPAPHPTPQVRLSAVVERSDVEEVQVRRAVDRGPTSCVLTKPAGPTQLTACCR